MKVFVKMVAMIRAVTRGISIVFCALFLTTSAFAQTVDEQSVQDALEAIRGGDIEKGASIMQRLGEQANPEALFHLAEMARLGVGRDASLPVAIMYYRMAGQMGNVPAALNLANILYFDGSGSEAEMAEAIGIWQTQALLGNSQAAFLLGMVYWNGEIGGTPDPIRGYGLVWRAAQSGYNDAVQAELTMRAQLNGDASRLGQKYGAALEAEGFSDELLGMNLLVDGYEVGSADADGEAAKKPEDWNTVWRLEVGFAMQEQDARKLLQRIQIEETATVKDFFGEVSKSPNRPGMFRLLFGPIGNMHKAVSSCVKLKRAGYDCFAKAPA
jgi:hypothetical protein